MEFITKEEWLDILLVPYNHVLTEEFREIMKDESSKDTYYDINLWLAKELISLKSIDMFQENYIVTMNELIRKLYYFQKNASVYIEMSELMNIFVTCFIFVAQDTRKVTTQKERDEHSENVKIIKDVIEKLKDKTSVERIYLDSHIKS